MAVLPPGRRGTTNRIFREIRCVGVTRFTPLRDAPGDHGGDLDPSRVVVRTLENIKEGRTMNGLLNSTVLGAVLLTGMALAARAQSVSASPPASGAPQQLVNPHPFGPKPSGSHMWKQEHYRNPADYATNRAFHPYSMSGVG
jgi:hypothetical protein